jgi:threonine dehydratase
MEPLKPATLEEIREARQRIAGAVIRTPLIRLDIDQARPEIYLKLENLQATGSFKLRGAGNAMLQADEQQLAAGVWTVSAGNMALGVAWHARCLGVRCTVVVPEHAPEAKLAALRQLDSTIVKVPYDEWVQVFITHTRPGMDGLFIHPVSDAGMLAGNGTIGLEILEELPDVDAIVVPFGGGGLSCGIASAIAAVKPEIPVWASEVASAAPLAASLAAGDRIEISRVPSFVDGIGAPVVLAEMWPLSSQLLAGSLVVSMEEVISAIKLLVARNHVVAEGAGATSVAAALAGKAGRGKIACVVSGGNIDTEKLVSILQDMLPEV